MRHYYKPTFISLMLSSEREYEGKGFSFFSNLLESVCISVIAASLFDLSDAMSVAEFKAF